MNKQRSFCSLGVCLLCLLWSQLVFAQTSTVLGFGDNSVGQIGDNTTDPRPLPTPALQISGVKAIACGLHHTLALDASGTVWAWGENYDGELGTGDTVPRHLPIPVLSGVKAIAAGDWHSLALKADGSVWAWGYNGSGQLGMNTTDWSPHSVPLEMHSDWGLRIKAIAAGSSHSLALAETGTLYGCGANNFGQLAQGDYATYPGLTVMLDRVVAMAGGGFHTLAQTADNNVYGAGYNASGQLGNGTTQGTNTWVFAMSNVRTIAAGSEHSLAVRQDGQAFAWGRNSDGQLGVGDLNPRLVPTAMPGAVNIKAVAAGFYHTLALTASGMVLATGENLWGQLGDGTIADDTGSPRNKLLPVKNATCIGSIAASGFHSVLLKPYNVLFGTGLNNHGQLGLGHLRQQNKPTQTARLDSNNYIAVAVGNTNGAHSLALRADGYVVSWGFNASGQLGLGSFTDSMVPIAVKGPNGVGYLSHIIAIAAGDSHSLALAADGTVYAWGGNDHGQLGIGNFINQPYPVRVPNRSNIFAIAAGGQHSLFLSHSGQSAAAGLNDHNQLGIGTGDSSVFRYTGQVNQIAIAAGASHSLSLDGTGQIYAWGKGSEGQLAFGDGLDKPYPILQPYTVASVIALICGGDHSLMLSGAGNVRVAGDNLFGELGLGDTAFRYSWNNNIYATQSIGFASGQNHCLFLNAFGSLYASGQGTFGALGNGTTANQSLPTFVMGGVTSMAGGGNYTLILTTPRIQIASFTVSSASLKGGANATGKITLNGLSGPTGQRVYLSVYNQGPSYDASTVPSYVDIPPMSAAATFPIATKPVSVETVAYLTAFLNNTVSATLTILP